MSTNIVMVGRLIIRTSILCRMLLFKAFHIFVPRNKYYLDKGVLFAYSFSVKP